MKSWLSWVQLYFSPQCLSILDAATTITIVNAVTLGFNVDVTFYGSTTEVSDELEPGPSYGTLDKPQGATKVKK